MSNKAKDKDKGGKSALPLPKDDDGLSDSNLKLKNAMFTMGSEIINLFTPLLTANKLPHDLSGVIKLLEGIGEQDVHLKEQIGILGIETDKGVDNLVAKAKEMETELESLQDLVRVESDRKKVAGDVRYLKKVKEEIDLKIEIVKLQQELQSNPPELMDNMHVKYVELQKDLEKMEKECKDMEERIREYESLGERFADLRTMYENQEEEIKTKEWVKEQLEQRGSSREQSFDDSFF